MGRRDVGQKGAITTVNGHVSAGEVVAHERDKRPVSVDLCVAVRSDRGVRDRIGQQSDLISVVIVYVNLVDVMRSELIVHHICAVDHRETSIGAYCEALKSFAALAQAEWNVLRIRKGGRCARQTVEEKDIASQETVIVALSWHGLGAEEHHEATVCTHVRRDRMRGEGIGAGNRAKKDWIRN